MPGKSRFISAITSVSNRRTGSLFRISSTFPGNAFSETQIYLSPFLGGTLYY